MPRSKRKHPVLTDEAVQLVAARFRALSDPTRLQLLNVLMQGESSVQGLVEATGVEQSNLSRHLAVLRREGIVARRSQGNRAIYRIHDPSVVQLCEVVCGGLLDRLSDELEALPDAKIWKGMEI